MREHSDQDKKKDTIDRKDIKSIRLLDKQEHVGTRTLWEKVFAEDTEDFLDYYYENCAEQNKIYAAESMNGELVSMAQLNPYQVRLNENLVDVHYIVGVATQIEYRHRGLMRELLTLALKECYHSKEPFLFLMPASESIYLPFDFRTVYYQNQMNYHLDRQQHILEETHEGMRAAEAGTQQSENVGREIQVCILSEAETEALADFSERILSKSYRVYVNRTRKYFEKMLQELKSEEGQVLMFKEDGNIVGYCFAASEFGIEVWELVAEESLEEEVFEALVAYLKRWKPESKEMKISAFPEQFEQEDTIDVPLIMTRIVNLVEFSKCLRAEQPVSFFIRVEDELLEENQGIFHFTVDASSAKAEKVDATVDTESVVSLSIAELSEIFFGVEESEGIPCELLVPLNQVFLNEVV